MLIVRAGLSGLAACLSITLGLLVLFRNPAARLNRTFALKNFFESLLILSGYPTLFLDYNHGLIVYRFLQIPGLWGCFFSVLFVHELTQRTNRRTATLARRSLLATVTLLSPLMLTRFSIESYSLELSTTAKFVRHVGPLFFVNRGLLMVCHFALSILLYQSFKSASGVRKNQIGFVLLAYCVECIAIVFTLLDLPWMYFPLAMLSTFCLAYAMLKWHLFDFTNWMKRMAIFGGLYVGMAILPFSLLPFREWVVAQVTAEWWFLPVITLAYSTLFMSLFLITSHSHDRREKERSIELEHQLMILKEASESLTGESGAPAEDIVRRSVDILREFYWERMKMPLRFVMVAVQTGDGPPAAVIYPPSKIDSAPLSDFLTRISAMPPLLTGTSFNQIDIEQKLTGIQKETAAADPRDIRRYLSENEIECCVPCLHDGKLFGALFLGTKSEGLFSPEELTTLRLTASHVANAVRKSHWIQRTHHLSELDTMKTDLISNITHEFKSPIGIVESAIEVLMKDIEAGVIKPDKVSDYLGMIRDSAGRLDEFIQNLLDVSKIQSAKVELNLTRCSLVSVIEDAVRSVRALADEKNLPINVHVQDVNVTADRPRLRQVFVNLLSNAVKFTESGEIRVLSKRGAEGLTVTVADTGAGIDPKFQAAVFERFFQAPSQDLGRTRGTGLGLAIAKGWVEAHGGRIRVESGGAGKGSSFIVELPSAVLEGA